MTEMSDLTQAEADEIVQAVSDNFRAALTTIMGRRVKDEFAWVIEHGNSPVSQPLYWTAGLPIKELPPRHWHSNHLEAIRFARKEDAEKIATALLEGVPVRICEHGWHG